VDSKDKQKKDFFDVVSQVIEENREMLERVGRL